MVVTIYRRFIGAISAAGLCLWSQISAGEFWGTDLSSTVQHCTELLNVASESGVLEVIPGRHQYQVQTATLLLALKPLARELQGSTVLGDGANHLVGRAIGHFGFDFNGDCDVGPNQCNQMGNDFVGDLAGIPADAGRVKHCSAVEALGFRSRGRLWYAGLACPGWSKPAARDATGWLPRHTLG